MFDPAYLDAQSEDELHELYNWCRACARKSRDRGNWGLYNFWQDRSGEVCNALGRLYMARDNPFAVRNQLELPNMPHRCEPDERPRRFHG